MIKQLIIKFTRSCLAILLFLFATLLFIGYTTPGLTLSLKLARIFLPGKLSIEKVNGQLFQHIDLSNIHYRDQSIDIHLSKLTLNWQLYALFNTTLHINNLSLNKLKIDTLPSNKNHKEQSVDSSNQADSALSLPINIIIDNLSVSQLNVNDEIKIDTIDAQANLSSSLIQVAKLQLTGHGYRFNSTLDFNLSDSYALHSTQTLYRANTLIAKSTIAGNTQLYQLNLRTKSPAIKLNASLENLQQLTAKGSWPSIKVAIADTPLKIGAGSFTINDQGSFSRGQYLTKLSANINLHHLQLDLLPPIQQIDSKINYSKANDKLKLNLIALYGNNKLSIPIEKSGKTVKAQLKLGTNVIDVNASLPFKWQLKASIPQLHLFSPALKNLSTKVTANAQLVNETNGTAKIMLAPGYFQMPNSPKRFTFTGGTTNFQLNQNGLSVSGDLAINQQDKISLSAKLAKLNLKTFNAATQPINAETQFTINDLSFIDKLSPQLSNSGGKLHAAIKLNGTLKQMKPSAHLNLQGGKTQLKRLGVNINPVVATASLTPSQWTLSGSASINQSLLTLNGQGILGSQQNAIINARGNNILLINNQEYQITVSPDIKLNYSRNKLSIAGNIIIPKAIITPKDFSSSQSLSDDVVFVRTKKTASPALAINTNINISFGNDVKLAFMGLTGKVRGQLKIQDSDNQATTALGVIRVKEGKFEAYGQKLKIEQADILYTGGAIDNPGIRIRASRQFTSSNSSNTLTQSGYFNFDAANLNSIDFSENTTVGIDISGRAKSPKVTLFSIPSNMSQADILSMLILGQPASQASNADAQLLMTAVSSLNLGGGSGGLQLMQQLQHKLGVDISFDKQSFYNQNSNSVSNSTALVVGKQLSPRLSVSYAMSLDSNEGGIFTLKYLLNKYFNVQINASTIANGIDIFYTYPN